MTVVTRLWGQIANLYRHVFFSLSSVLLLRLDSINTCTSYWTWPQGRVGNNSTTLTYMVKGTPLRCRNLTQIHTHLHVAKQDCSEILVLAFNGELIIIQSFSLTIEKYPPLKCLRVATSEMFYTHCLMPCSLSKESSFDYCFYTSGYSSYTVPRQKMSRNRV